MPKQKDGFKGQQSIVLSPMVVSAAREDPLASSLYLTDIGYYPDAHNHYRERKTPITEHVLIYCVKGAGWYELRGKRTILKSGKFIILPTGEPHAYGASEKAWTIYWVHFAGEHAQFYVEGMQKPQRVQVAVNSQIGYRHELFERIVRVLSDSANIENLRYASSILHYYLASIR